MDTLQVIEEFMSLADGQAVLRSQSSAGEEALEPVTPEATSSGQDPISGGFGPTSCSITIPGGQTARVSFPCYTLQFTYEKDLASAK